MEAVDGVEGLRKVQAERPDLILMDIQLPRMEPSSVNSPLPAKARWNGSPATPS